MNKNKIRNIFKKKRILITGHTGFKGSWLSQILLNWKANLIGVAFKPTTKPNLFTLLKLKNKIKNYFIDVRNFKKIKEIFDQERPEIVFHLAAQSLVRESYDHPSYTFETNLMGTVNVLQAIKETKSVRAGVMITTDKVYKNKENNYPYKESDELEGREPYSASKVGAEIAIDSYIKSFFNPKNYAEHKTLIASARSGNALGGGDWAKDRLLPDIVRAVFKNRKVVIRNPSSIRPWQHVLEPLYGYLLLAEKLYKGKKEFSGAWNFGPHKESCLTVKELVRRVFKVLKKGSSVIKRDSLKNEAKSLSLNITKAMTVLRWQPSLNINKSLDLTLDWYKAFYNQENMLEITKQQIESFFN
jgi:CDP-glucose 4,6-dehydratase